MTQREQQILDWITEDPMISQEALAERAGCNPGPQCGPSSSGWLSLIHI